MALHDVKGWQQEIKQLKLKDISCITDVTEKLIENNFQLI